MKPWIGHALVWTGLIGFGALVGETVGRVQPVEHALVLYVWLLILLYAIAIFATESAWRATPPDYEHQSRMDDAAKRLAEHHFGSVSREGACLSENSKPGLSARHGS